MYRNARPIQLDALDGGFAVEQVQHIHVNVCSGHTARQRHAAWSGEGNIDPFQLQASQSKCRDGGDLELGAYARFSRLKYHTADTFELVFRKQRRTREHGREHQQPQQPNPCIPA